MSLISVLETPLPAPAFSGGERAAFFYQALPGQPAWEEQRCVTSAAWRERILCGAVRWVVWTDGRGVQEALQAAAAVGEDFLLARALQRCTQVAASVDAMAMLKRLGVPPRMAASRLDSPKLLDRLLTQPWRGTGVAVQWDGRAPIEPLLRLFSWAHAEVAVVQLAGPPADPLSQGGVVDAPVFAGGGECPGRAGAVAGDVGSGKSGRGRGVGVGSPSTWARRQVDSLGRGWLGSAPRKSAKMAARWSLRSMSKS